MERLLPIIAPNSFTRVTATLRSGTPDRGRNAETLVKTHEDQTITVGGRLVQRGLLQGDPQANNAGTLEVDDNDFSAVAEIILGDYALTANLDFIPGALVGDTAVNITAAINRLTDFSATVVGALVTINYVRRTARVPFRVCHYGTVTNFIITPTTGWMTDGDPTIGPPKLT